MENNSDPNIKFRIISFISGLVTVIFTIIMICLTFGSEKNIKEDPVGVSAGLGTLILFPIILISSVSNVVNFFQNKKEGKIFGLESNYFEKIIHIIFLFISVAVLCYPVGLIIIAEFIY